MGRLCRYGRCEAAVTEAVATKLVLAIIVALVLWGFRQIHKLSVEVAVLKESGKWAEVFAEKLEASLGKRIDDSEARQGARIDGLASSVHELRDQVASLNGG